MRGRRSKKRTAEGAVEGAVGEDREGRRKDAEKGGENEEFTFSRVTASGRMGYHD